MGAWVRIAGADEVKKKIEKLYSDPVLRETALAYADNVANENGWDTEVAFDIRSLTWSGQYVDAMTFLKQAKIVGEYNAFNPGIAKEITEVYPNSQFRLAREGSVAVYVKPASKAGRYSFDADEVDLNGDELRIWWD